MFEFEDSKLGRVKVVNITEARSAIAAIMKDKEFNYVIMKNNKPVNYVAGEVGYEHGSALARIFKKKLGLSPRQWLQQTKRNSVQQAII